MLASHVSVAISLMSALSVRPRTYFVSDSPSRKDMPSMIGLPTCLRLLTHGQLLAINAHKPCLIDITPSPTNNPSNQCDQSQSRPNILPTPPKFAVHNHPRLYPNYPSSQSQATQIHIPKPPNLVPKLPKSIVAKATQIHSQSHPTCSQSNVPAQQAHRGYYRVWC